jgi:hypothetical protein
MYDNPLPALPALRWVGDTRFDKVCADSTISLLPTQRSGLELTHW